MRKTAVVTGASSGVGRAGAILLAEAGWNVIGLGRDQSRSSEALEAIRAAAHPDAIIQMIIGDLASLSDTARMAREILSHTQMVDLLCNNAGGVRNERIITPEGNEATFAGNHLGHFLLTKRLLPALEAAAANVGSHPARILNVSSEGHHQAPEINWNDLQSINGWVSGRSYCIAKLCNVLFTAELARRYAQNGIVAHALHPGEAATNFASHAVPEMQAYMQTLDMIPPEVAGRTILWLATSDEAARTSGGYYFNCRAVPASPKMDDAELAARLWSESEALLVKAGF